MYVQGGQFEGHKQTSPVEWCKGDMIILYSAPYTADGLRSPFKPVHRITPCLKEPVHYTSGNLFFGRSEAKL